LRAFSSQEADLPGSENLLGLKSRAVDFLIGRILDAQSEHDLETAAHAFDRVMVAHAYVLPWRWLKNHYVMYNRRLQRPPTLPLYYGATEWALADWWDGSAEGATPKLASSGELFLDLSEDGGVVLRSRGQEREVPAGLLARRPSRSVRRRKGRRREANGRVQLGVRLLDRRRRGRPSFEAAP
jgi:hypothetical protein